MNKFGIFSPVMGKREDFPSILLDKAFTPDHSNVQAWNGELRSAKMRTPELLRTTYAIVIADTSADHFEIDDDHTAEFLSGDTFRVYDSTGNDAQWTCSGDSTTSGTTTVITVTGDITDATADGRLYNDEDVASNTTTSVDFLKVQPPDGYEFMAYHLLVQNSAGSEVEKLVGFTKAHVYQWDTGRQKWIAIHTNSADCSSWSFVQVGDYLAVTNNIDVPLSWDGTFATMSGIDVHASGPEVSTGVYMSKAKHVTTYENYVLFGDVALSDSSILPEQAYWSVLGYGVGASADYKGEGSGNMRVTGKGSRVTGFGFWQDYLCIFKDKSWRKIWFTGGDDIFNQAEGSPSVGTRAPDSIINDQDGRLYWYGNDMSFHEASLDRISQGLDVTARNISPEYVSLIKSIYIAEYGEIRWAVPAGAGVSANNKVLAYKDGKWDVYDIAVTAFGLWNRVDTWTWDTIPFATWDEIGWERWDSVESDKGFPVDICSDSAGNTYALHGGHKDNGSSHTRYFVLTTDLSDKRALGWYKRIQQIRLYVFKEGAGDLTIEVKRDNEPEWQSVGTVSLNGTPDLLIERLPVDIRARTFLFKISATSAFRFVGMAFGFLPVGDR